jgi:superoxide reductase
MARDRNAGDMPGGPGCSLTLREMEGEFMTAQKFGDLIYTFDAAAGEALGKRESHTPKIEAPARVKPDELFDLKVTVGPHPNTVEHAIRWIMVAFEEEGRAFNPVYLGKASFNAVTTQPEVTLKVRLAKGGVIHAVEYCNLHGLWAGKKEIKIQ